MGQRLSVVHCKSLGSRFVCSLPPETPHVLARVSNFCLVHCCQEPEPDTGVPEGFQQNGTMQFLYDSQLHKDKMHKVPSTGPVHSQWYGIPLFTTTLTVINNDSTNLVLAQLARLHLDVGIILPVTNLGHSEAFLPY